MTTNQKPQGIRINVPVQRFGPLYAGQWVEFRQLVLADSEAGRFFRAVRRSPLLTKEDHLQYWFSRLILDWNLEGDDGPLPKPWRNPTALGALQDSDAELYLWVGTQASDLIPTASELKETNAE